MSKSPEDLRILHGQVLELALRDYTQEQVIEELKADPRQIKFMWLLGVVNPVMPSIESLLRDRDKAIQLQNQNQKIALLEQELSLAEQERKIVVEHSQQQTAMLRAKAKDEEALAKEVTRNLGTTAKGHAVAQLAIVASFNPQLEEIAKLLRASTEARIKDLQSRPRLTAPEQAELRELMKEIINISKAVMINAHRAASVHKLLADSGPSLTQVNNFYKDGPRNLDQAKQSAELLMRNLEREKKQNGRTIDMPAKEGSSHVG